MPDRKEFERRQRALADFGQFVLDHDDLHAILTEACRLIAFALSRVRRVDQRIAR